MNLTLHLTERCNLDCSYCVNDKCNAVMSEKVLFAACDLAFSRGNSAGICFFGGEPLLEKELIYKAFDYCAEKSEKTGKKIRYKMTTNGTLLDEDFINRAAEEGLEIGLSFDGLAQDICRRYTDGSGTFSVLEEKAKMLLKKLPLSYAMLTLAPKAVEKFADSVIYLRSIGFHRVTATIAYGKRVSWTEERMSVLRNEFLKIADFYTSLFIKGERFFFSPFDSKIRECISGFNPSERCHLGLRQMPVSAEGKLYACTQFMGDEEYCFGDVFSGVSEKAVVRVSRKNSLPAECMECDLKTRCTNSCGCMNRLETGNELKISPTQCTYERMLIEICDNMADELFEKYPERFKRRFTEKKDK